MTATPDEECAERIKSLPLEQQVAIFVAGTRSLNDFVAQKIRPVITSQLKRSPLETAVAATYERMCLLVEALVKLEEPRHFQVAAMVTRSLFELLLDLKILVSDPGSADKFFDFADIDKFRNGERRRGFLAANPTIDPRPHHAASMFANDPARRQRLEQLCVRHWGTKKNGEPEWPNHWSGIATIKGRAARVGPEYEEFYRSDYWFQSCYVHSGVTGILNLSREFFEEYFAIAHHMAQRFFIEATRLVAEVYHLFQMEPGLQQDLENASNLGTAQAIAKLLEVRESQPEQ